MPWLRAEAVEARSVALAWARPAGDLTDYELQYLAAADRLEAAATPALRLLVTGLQPYTAYTFTLEVRLRAPARFQISPMYWSVV